jgi:hypothetical protein
MPSSEHRLWDWDITPEDKTKPAVGGVGALTDLIDSPSAIIQESMDLDRMISVRMTK